MVKANHALSNSALKYENLHANYPVCIFFLNPAAEIMFNTLFNIILKTKPGNTERRRRRRKKKNKEGTFTTIFAAGLTSSFLLRPTEVNLSDANKNPSSARVIAIYEFPVTVLQPSAQMLSGDRHEFLERVKNP